jgi:hypothetical protein
MTSSTLSVDLQKTLPTEIPKSLRLLCTQSRVHQDRKIYIENRPYYRPYSKLGTMTGPYFIGALYGPSF